MTNKERQKQYRDKKRGGPPQGRWAGYLSAAKRGEITGASRTGIFMAQWIHQHAPDVFEQLKAGKGKVTPIYKRLKREYEQAIFAAVEACPGDEWELAIGRRDGEFVFEWIK